MPVKGFSFGVHFGGDDLLVFLQRDQSAVPRFGQCLFNDVT